MNLCSALHGLTTTTNLDIFNEIPVGLTTFCKTLYCAFLTATLSPGKSPTISSFQSTTPVECLYIEKNLFELKFGCKQAYTGQRFFIEDTTCDVQNKQEKLLLYENMC